MIINRTYCISLSRIFKAFTVDLNPLAPINPRIKTITDSHTGLSNTKRRRHPSDRHMRQEILMLNMTTLRKECIKRGIKVVLRGRVDETPISF